MNRHIVVIESPDFFLAELDRIAGDEGDVITIVSPEERHRTRPNAIALDIRRQQDEAVEAIKQSVGTPDAVITSQEMFMAHAASVADRFGVLRDPLAAVLSSRDKAMMKAAWAESGVRTPQSVFCQSASDIPDAARELGFPLIVKPSQGYASAGVRRVDTAEELSQHLRQVMLLNSTVVAREGLPGAGVLAEEYVGGQEFSIDTIWFAGRPLVDGILCKGDLPGPYFPDGLYYLDPHLPAGIASQVKEISHQAVRSLGIRHGATHTEVRFRGNEPFVLETTNRPGAGGLFYHLFSKAFGIDFFRLYYLAAVGIEPALVDPRRPAVGVYPFWYNIPHRGSGVIREIRGIQELRSRPEVEMCLAFKGPGSVLYPDGLGVDYFCSILGTYRRGPGDPPLENMVTRYDGALEVIF